MSDSNTSLGISRRTVIGTGAGLAVAVSAGAAWMAWSRPDFTGNELTVREAHEAAKSGTILLIDIRRPDEWKRTGIAEGAHAIDMRRRDFVEALDSVAAGQKTVPIALICARGVRSARLSALLSAAGYTNIINIPEGMLGSSAGPGWIKSGLPLRQSKN